MTAALLTGAGFGLGLALLLYGLRPPRPALATVLDTLRASPQPIPTGSARVYNVVAAPLRRAGLPRAGVRADLAVLQRDPALHLAEQTVATAAGALAAPLAAAGFGFSGQVPLWMALIGGLIGFRWTDARLRKQAEHRRAQLRHTLSVMLTLLTIGLARGAGLEQALNEVIGVCTGPAAERLRRALATAQLLRQPPWPALGRLGEETQVGELAELAAAMSLAGTEGARIRAALTARATAIRTAATTSMETAAEKAGSRMALPLLVLGLSYLLALLYPPLVAMGANL